MGAEGLPDGLPVPVDDSAADHLPGRSLPALALATTGGRELDLSTVAGRWVLFVYPMTGVPGRALPSDWDEIPGARGCTSEACSFRDNLAGLRQAGVGAIFGLSAQPLEEQAEAVERLHLPYELVSDPGLALAQAMDLPTFQADGMTIYRRLTMVLDGPAIARVVYPVFPPDQHAAHLAEELLAAP